MNQTKAATPGETNLVEHILWHEQPLAYIMRAAMQPAKTTFLTLPQFKRQIGFVVYPQGGEVAPHVHFDLERHLVGSSEVLLIQRGPCSVDIYYNERELVATRELQTFDILIMVRDGHGFRMLEDTVFVEMKQGPYLDAHEEGHLW
jgi:hypothetical protein